MCILLISAEESAFPLESTYFILLFCVVPAEIVSALAVFIIFVIAVWLAITVINNKNERKVNKHRFFIKIPPLF